MGKLKELVTEMAEMLDDGYTIAEISEHTGLPQDVVFDMMKQSGLVEPGPVDYISSL